ADRRPGDLPWIDILKPGFDSCADTSQATRRLPRYVSPARGGIRHTLARRLRRYLSEVRTESRLGSPQGISLERFEEAARKSRRSSRAHWRRPSGPRTVSPARQRHSFQRFADASRDAEDAGTRPPSCRRGRARREELEHATGARRT